MKILIINPNSDHEMTEKILKTAQGFAGSSFEVVCVSTPGAPKFIETYEDQVKAAPGMIQVIKEHTECNAYVIACHCDPNLDILKEITETPVVGIGEASMKIASMLGHSFSVITATDHSIPQKEELVRKYHLQNVLASIRAPESGTPEKYLQAAQHAVTRDNAEVIVLGCAGMTGLDKKLQKKLGVPVLDGVVCGLIIASGLALYNISISKRKRYNPEYIE
ncbi:MAG: aspartate/glutamate racemase family protein [Candidatus Methanofastidiosia archaeon]|jgi:allantoin racemase